MRLPIEPVGVLSGVSGTPFGAFGSDGGKALSGLFIAAFCAVSVADVTPGLAGVLAAAGAPVAGPLAFSVPTGGLPSG